MRDKLKDLHERLDDLACEIRDAAHGRGDDDSVAYDLRYLVDELGKLIEAYTARA